MKHCILSLDHRKVRIEYFSSEEKLKNCQLYVFVIVSFFFFFLITAELCLCVKYMQAHTNKWGGGTETINSSFLISEPFSTP